MHESMLERRESQEKGEGRVEGVGGGGYDNENSNRER